MGSPGECKGIVIAGGCSMRPVVGDDLLNRQDTRQKVYQMKIGHKPIKSFQKLAIASVIVASALTTGIVTFS
jgi:hypothetical protein